MSCPSPHTADWLGGQWPPVIEAAHEHGHAQHQPDNVKAWAPQSVRNGQNLNPGRGHHNDKLEREEDK